jgi:PPK2 family polyphosphate:nucleotide phosphotransferase
MAKPIRLRDLDMDLHLRDKEAYEDELEHLQEEMLRIQQAYYHNKLRAVLVFEGWDAAGKGGAIRRLTEALDPRGYHVYPIGAPDPVEQGKHYLYRFWQRLPQRGTMAIFDRSWYGRVLVERVEGFADKKAWQRAYDEINEFESLLHDDGIRVVKVFMHITKQEQLKRFVQRLTDPAKRWKIGPDDLRNRKAWPAYEQAIDDMFARTSTRVCPWHVVEGDHKWYARTRVLEIVTRELSRGVDLRAPEPDKKFLRKAANMLGVKLKKLQ